MTTREETMNDAVPRLAKGLKSALAKEPAWRSLFEVFGADKEDPARQRVRVVEIASTPLPPPAGLPEESNASHLTGSVAGSTTIRTTLALDRDEVTVAGSEYAKIEPKFEGLYSAAGRAASAVLFDATKSKFKVVVEKTTALNDLAKVLPDACASLGAGVIDLLVSAKCALTIAGEQRKPIERALNGGAVVPVAGITDDDRAYVLAHQSGAIRIETVRAPAVSWEWGADGRVDVVVSEEFIVVSRARVRVCEVTFSPKTGRSEEGVAVMAAEFEVYKDKAGEFRWRLQANNNEVVASSGQGYTSKSSCRHGIEVVKMIAASAPVNDLTD